MERPNRCAAENCLCTGGRDFDEPSNELLICETCGSSCIHKNCWQRKEPYFCCLPINEKGTDENQNNSVKSKNNDFNKSTTTNSSIGTVRRKRKIVQTDDYGKGKKRRKADKQCGSPSVAKSTVECSTKLDFTSKDINITKKFPIVKIRNGAFDQILRFTPRVLICPLSLDKFKISSRGIDLSVNIKTITDKTLKTTDIDTNTTIADRSLKTLNVDNLQKKELLTPSVTFAVISPPKKSGGKSFKNYTITSFFKPG